jgi:hypothetical protein
MRRQDVRSDAQLNGIKGLLTHTDRRDASGAQAHEPFIVFNISDTGLGLWVTSKCERGERVTVTIAKPLVLVLSCEVRWCREATSEDGQISGYQVGLKVLDHLQRLEALHRNLAGNVQNDQPLSDAKPLR